MGNIEYGNIENGNFDSNLKSKIMWLLISKKSDGNIEFNIDFFNIDSKTGSNGVPCGVGGWGVTADDDRGCYDPV